MKEGAGIYAWSLSPETTPKKAAKLAHALAMLLPILLYYTEAKKAAKMLTLASIDPLAVSRVLWVSTRRIG